MQDGHQVIHVMPTSAEEILVPVPPTSRDRCWKDPSSEIAKLSMHLRLTDNLDEGTL